MQENICKKYEITREELQEGVKELLSNIKSKDYKKADVIFALSDLLSHGDIEPVEGVGKHF